MVIYNDLLPSSLYIFVHQIINSIFSSADDNDTDIDDGEGYFSPLESPSSANAGGRRRSTTHRYIENQFYHLRMISMLIHPPIFAFISRNSSIVLASHHPPTPLNHAFFGVDRAEDDEDGNQRRGTPQHSRHNSLDRSIPPSIGNAVPIPLVRPRPNGGRNSAVRPLPTVSMGRNLDSEMHL
jgi:hypothetical protein